MEAKGGILDEIEEFSQGKHSQLTFQYGCRWRVSTFISSYLLVL